MTLRPYTVKNRLIVDNKWMGPDFKFKVHEVRELPLKDGKTICQKGIKLWCEQVGVDYQDFRKNGISVHTAVESGDARAKMAALQYYRKYRVRCVKHPARH
jgi:hypothetical protein